MCFNNLTATFNMGWIVPVLSSHKKSNRTQAWKPKLHFMCLTNLTSSNTLILCIYQSSFHSYNRENTTEVFVWLKCVSVLIASSSFSAQTLQSNLSHSGIAATCECHQHQFTHGQGTLAMNTGYFLCILELFPSAWLWNHSSRLLLFQISTLDLTRSKLIAAEVTQQQL